MSLYDKLFPPKVYTLPNGKQVAKKRSRAPLWTILIIAFCALSIRITGFDMSVLVKRGNQFWVILGQMFPPETAYLPNIWEPIFDTIKMSLLGSFIGSVLCIPFAMLASTNVCKSRVVVFLMRLMFSIVRTLPTLVTALIATFIFGLGTIAGTTAIAVFSFSYIGKILYEEIETVDMGAFEAMEAMGATKTQAFYYAVLLQDVGKARRLVGERRIVHHHRDGRLSVPAPCALQRHFQAQALPVVDALVILCKLRPRQRPAP